MTESEALAFSANYLRTISNGDDCLLVAARKLESYAEDFDE